MTLFGAAGLGLSTRDLCDSGRRQLMVHGAAPSACAPVTVRFVDAVTGTLVSPVSSDQAHQTPSGSGTEPTYPELVLSQIGEAHAYTGANPQFIAYATSMTACQELRSMEKPGDRAEVTECHRVMITARQSDLDAVFWVTTFRDARIGVGLASQELCEALREVRNRMVGAAVGQQLNVNVWMPCVPLVVH
jgi:hypothetical protein